MKTKTILCIVAATCAALGTGCRSSARHEGTATRGLDQISRPPAVAAPDPIRWTLETEVPDDPAERAADVRQHMTEFARKGWSVLSAIKHIRPEDGKQYRKWELQRDGP